jgi:hypothetical protein
VIGQRRLALAALALAAAAPEPAATAEIALRWSAPVADPARAVVELTGLDTAAVSTLDRENTTPAAWQEVLAVRSGPGATAQQTAPGALPPMAGSYRTLRDGIQFTPMFPLAAGIDYVATVNRAKIPGLPADAAPLRASHRLPIAPSPAAATIVTQVYPTAQTLPENLLKFYVHFSAPMSRGGIYEHVRLVDSAGKTVEIPFLELDEELWNPAMTRLTLFIDPGRIKRGVRPLEEIGPALVAGERFRLIINRTCRDANGRPMAASYEKAFMTGPPEREPLDPEKWKITPPRAGGRAPLLVGFRRPLDQAITQRALRVVDGLGKVIEGKVELKEQERGWEFVPVQSWRHGRHQLVVPTAIEDLAGNNIGKPFEVDLQEGDSGQFRAPATSVVKIPFEVQ